MDRVKCNIDQEHFNNMHESTQQAVEDQGLSVMLRNPLSMDSSTTHSNRNHEEQPQKQALFYSLGVPLGATATLGNETDNRQQYLEDLIMGRISEIRHQGAQEWDTSAVHLAQHIPSQPPLPISQRSTLVNCLVSTHKHQEYSQNQSPTVIPGHNMFDEHLDSSLPSSKRK